MGGVNSCFCNKQSNNVAVSDTGAEDRNNNMEDEDPIMGGASYLHQSQIGDHPVPHPNFIIQLLSENMNTRLALILPSHLRTGTGPSTPIPHRSSSFQQASQHRPTISHPVSHYRPGRVRTVQDLRCLRPANRVPGFNWSPIPSRLASPTYDTTEQGDLTSAQVDLPVVRNLEDEIFDLSWQLSPEDEEVELTHSPVAGDEGTPEETKVGVVKCSEEATPEDTGVGEVTCPVCLDGIAIIKSSGRSVMSTICGHIFCSSCLPACIRTKHSCPTCRMTLWEFDIHPIFI